MRLSNVSFAYRRRAPAVLRDVDADLAPGDVIEVVGANGAGKSTLLRLLAGITRPTHGTVTDRPRVVGFAPDRFPVDQPFTVTQYLTHISRIRGNPAWRPWATRLGLDDLLDVRLAELSKGSAHKVGLVQALMPDPGLLILDEPFAGLDADTRAQLPAIITAARTRGAIVILSDHQGGLDDLPAVRHWSLHDGHLKESTPSATSEPSSPPTKVVHVTVPATEVDAFLTQMRQAGFEAQEAEEGQP
ncbi:ATP-binding cassette domain-containing protein [Nonomuraea sp. NPDC050328]|uniref:ABC transporter ATP-binding protein n=1 Tax=Nonomuraea sp. NPDC050328 TaxID=3364361 RepID=UPI0037A0C862